MSEPTAIFEEAVRRLSDKQVIGSRLSSAEWRERVAVGLRERAFLSATVENARVLQTMQDYLGDYMRKAIDPETGGLKAQGRAEFVADMRELCIREGLGKVDPETGSIAAEIDEDDLTDLRSMARLQLIFDTQTEQAHEFGYWSQGNDPDLLDAFPAQRFIRVRPVRTPRPYHAAAEGMVRLKDDLNFWLAMNPDFGVPYGPWGFNSGMGVEDVDRIEAEELGLIKPGQKISQPDRKLNDTLSAGVRDLSPEMKSELKGIFGDQVVEREGRMEWISRSSSPSQPAPQTPAPFISASQLVAQVQSAADRAEAHSLIALPQDKAGKLILQSAPKGIVAENAKKGVAFMEQLLHKDFQPTAPLSIKRDPAKHPRGGYSSYGKIAFIRNDAGNSAHEIMHHIEHENPSLYQAAKTFRLSRTNGETAKQLSILTGDTGYDPSEIAYEDEWQKRGGDHYAGKSYPPGYWATEILTMGVERLYEDPIGFAAQDPDYFEFLIKTLQKL